ncbi:nitrogen regulatory protein PII [Desulfosporosinus acidiphilus SJ4]|uniref:Nitrogen regulatory protein PII n=1 Tax=Desulfosporosinus acidiphilus (strain DSM 22704 / JCM 16185 / SJ4) TaxID=646529 RepID=I4D4F3_DESAJ|nr:P-II family nitrogen regulator [Desulfosporosinus acidiphilus]AFM40677.1 nitrogen regulatory protein PII [Desulfosporosinus acidiphilus SJ4]
MKKVEAIIRPEKLDEVKEALSKNWINRLTNSHVFGSGNQRGYIKVYRNVEFNAYFIPKMKVEVVVRDEDVDRVVEIITEMSRTGIIGDGKIVIAAVEDAVAIRTGNKGERGL